MHRLKFVLLCAIFLLSANACGLRGPLYLPGAETPATPAGTEETESQQDEEKDNEDGGIHEQNS